MYAAGAALSPPARRDRLPAPEQSPHRYGTAGKIWWLYRFRPLRAGNGDQTQAGHGLVGTAATDMAPLIVRVRVARDNGDCVPCDVGVSPGNGVLWCEEEPCQREKAERQS